MALQHFHHLLFFIFFLSLICISPIIGNANRVNMPSRLALDFIKQLEGSKKGNKLEGIHHVKNYLHQFGYLQTLTQNHDDEFDETLESAIKTYQQNYHITPTGTLDAATVSKMTIPRCGVPDIINGRNTMQPKMGKNDNYSSSSTSDDIHTVSHYSFFRGKPKWRKVHLTYQFLPNTLDMAEGPILRAFQKWHSNSPFNFSQWTPRKGSSKADLVIGFYKRAHGDGYPFDGPGTVLAHAFPPTNGRLHFDADEKWADPPVDKNEIDIETVGLHEIGHLLGLEHSSVKAAIMYAYASPGVTKTNFNADDINGIKNLYPGY